MRERGVQGSGLGENEVEGHTQRGREGAQERESRVRGQEGREGWTEIVVQVDGIGRHRMYLLLV